MPSLSWTYPPIHLANSDSPSGLSDSKTCTLCHGIPRNGGEWDQERRGCTAQDPSLKPIFRKLSRAFFLLSLFPSLNRKCLVHQWNWSHELPAKGGSHASAGFGCDLGGELIIYYALSRYLSTHQHGPT
jgi:hypothetical protein